MNENRILSARDRQIESIQDKVEEVIKSNLGNLALHSSSTSLTEIDGLISLFFEPSNETANYKGTDFFYKDYLTNFSSYKNALSILNSSEFWLWNLVNKNDASELSYAGDLFAKYYANSFQSYYFKESYDDVLSTLRQNFFILSLTHCNNISNFWTKEYTSYGHGIGFEIDLYNNIDKYKEFIISEIKYGQGHHFEKLSDDFDRLRQEYKLLNIKVNLNSILPLFKSGDKKWVEEEEIRILTPLPKENKFRVWMDQGDERQKHIRLPILSNKYPHDDYIKATFPFFKLRCLHIGPQITNEEFEQIEAAVASKYYHNIDLKRY